MTDPIYIFISHAWYTSKWYTELVEILSAQYGFEWIDTSIPESRALTVSADGDEQLADLHRMQMQHKDVLQHHMTECRDRIETYHNWLRLESLIAEAREHILQSDFSKRLKRLESELAKRKQFGGADVIKAELAKELETKRGLEARIARPHFPVQVQAVGKIHASLVEENGNLPFAIANRILSSDIMLVIGETFAMYRKWVEFEFEIASYYGKQIPAIGLLTPGSEKLPVEIMHRCAAVAHWVGKDIIACIQRLHRSPLTIVG